MNNPELGLSPPDPFLACILLLNIRIIFLIVSLSFLSLGVRLNVKLKIVYNKERSDGMPKKCLDISLAKKYGWKPTNNLDYGFDLTLRDFLKIR